MAFIGFRISDKCKNEIQSIANEMDVTVSAIVRTLIKQFLQEAKANEHQ